MTQKNIQITIFCSLDLSKVYDFKFCIFVCPGFWKDTFGLNYMSKDALFVWNHRGTKWALEILICQETEICFIHRLLHQRVSLLKLTS